MKKKSESIDIITTTCSYDCGGRCLLEVHVKNNRIIDIKSKVTRNPGLKACARGLAQKDIANHPNRLKTPLKRYGKRGSGAFKPVAWDEALDTVAGKLKQVISNHGTGSICFVPGSGSMSVLNNTGSVAKRFFGMLGKCTTVCGGESLEGALQSSLATFGSEFTGSTRDNLLYSKLIILWGWNPKVTRFGSDTLHYLLRAKKAGARIICVDPRNNQTGQTLADQWIPVRPGTDTAMLIAMAWVMMDEKLYDRNFVQKYTHGFDNYYDYVMGKEDGLEKNPRWAASICGVSPDSIKSIAREYARIKPAALITGWAPGRSAYGEQFHRAASVLAALTANIGIKGGFVSGGTDIVNLGRIKRGIPIPDTEHYLVHNVKLYDSLMYGRKKGYKTDCRLLYLVGSNFLNQHPNLNKGKEALIQQNFIVVHDLFLTPTARFADIVLPVTHYLEQNDIGLPWIGGPFVIFMEKAVEPPPGLKSDFGIFTEISKRLGIDGYREKTDQKYLEEILEKQPGFPDLATLKKAGLYRLDNSLRTAFSSQIKDPANHPFKTPSGKIEIFSHMFADMRNPLIPPIPKYIPAWEGPESEKIKDYPIQLITPHSKIRINSQLDNTETLKKDRHDRLWLNPEDAYRRKIKDGDMVLVYNNRGRMRARIRITENIMPGTASMDQGKWYDPDEKGINCGGSVNVLTLDRSSPAGSLASNTCLVQVEKI
ncbi:MAG: molybdopterin-containing oxidoreductase family protein [Actinomycetota bacterium]